jgi:hypothetical protein
MNKRIAGGLAGLLLVGVAGCSSSKSTAGGMPKTGDVLPPAKSSSAAAAPKVDLGQPLTVGALKLTLTGPVDAKMDGTELYVNFPITAANTSTAGDVAYPDWFGVRCDANRSGKVGDMYQNSDPKQRQRISAGQAVTGHISVGWLTWDKAVRCTGETLIEVDGSQGPVGYWRLPSDIVDQVNKLVP